MKNVWLALLSALLCAACVGGPPAPLDAGPPPHPTLMFPAGGTILPDAGLGGTWCQSDTGVAPVEGGNLGQVLTVGSNGLPAYVTPTTTGVLYTLTGNPATDVNATTTETALFSYTLPANTLPTNGVIQIQALTSAFNNSGGNVTQTYRLYFGVAVQLTWTGTNGTSNSHDVVQVFNISIVATGATNAQYYEGSSIANVGATSGGSALIEVTANSQLGQANTAAGVDTTFNQTIKLTAQSTSSNATVHAKLYSVKLVLQ